MDMYSIKFAAKLVNIKELRNRIVEKLSIFIVLSTYYLTFRVVHRELPGFKESFRDLIGRNHSRILLNVGFITPDPSPEDIRDIGRCLNWLQSHRNEQDLFGDAMSRYTQEELLAEIRDLLKKK